MVRYGAKISNLFHKSNSPARNFPAKSNAPLFVPANNEGYPTRRYGWRGKMPARSGQIGNRETSPNIQRITTGTPQRPPQGSPPTDCSPAYGILRGKPKRPRSRPRPHASPPLPLQRLPQHRRPRDGHRDALRHALPATCPPRLPHRRIHLQATRLPCPRRALRHRRHSPTPAPPVRQRRGRSLLQNNLRRPSSYTL